MSRTNELSTEQQAVILAGTRAKEDRSFTFVTLPEGRQPLPEWCTGLAVEWHPGYWNSPSIKLRVRGDVSTWDGKQFTYQHPRRWIARHPDGRACQHFHDNVVTWCNTGRIVECDEDITIAGLTTRIKHKRTDHYAWATRQENGYGGSYFPIIAAPGTEIVTPEGKKILEAPTEIVLRGSWHGGAPEGYVDVNTYDTDNRFHDKWYQKQGIPWYHRGGHFGLYITEDLLLRLFARFAPHHQMARVTEHGRTYLQPVHGNWDCPKSWLIDKGKDRHPIFQKHEPYNKHPYYRS